ncbi:tRNA lysidine(34) synthetase TilS [Cryobacterium sp. TMT2-18-3]|uniref:tRNA lysidine(34) synthetase TilS n=1 Tax=unclassified Cryobacterium TaxID=2649013 RepID=UPI00106B5191|nr:MULTISPECIES: tRNA lysidine(34) synthetase TilS [unclassified Cryobacterium]TFC30314.1 tRNA lysidine(34) synthetase TilS [Cryobacterium sp. TMT2-18-2]TFC40085.1 tRNA lysidine(34) synthetase TilS [Cryobacterium sp. TMT2-42-4]TFC63620.1 tRNA lysidine(34) synthetase TilS [Cryobacterium sp. TMT2-18-3]
MESPRRPRLTPAIADVRRHVRTLLIEAGPARGGGLVLVGLSGGADSLALAAATAFEAPRAGLRAGAVIVDHALQDGSAGVAAAAAGQARELGLDPVLVLRVTVDHGTDAGGPEASARTARYAAFDQARRETGASHILLGHTLDDQAETVLLGLARGSGPTSLQGMKPVGGPILRPLLGIRRARTRQFCVDAGLHPWQDPHNDDPRFQRVRVRQTVLPVLERELGPGVAEALVRTAGQLREDSSALDDLARGLSEQLSEPLSDPADGAGIRLDASRLEANLPAVRQRIIRFSVEREFGVSLERVHTLAVLRLVTDWHGQKPLDLPGIRVIRQDGWLIFTAPGHAPSKGPSRSHGTPRH